MHRIAAFSPPTHRVLRERVERLVAEVERPLLRRPGLRKVVAVQDDVLPGIPVQVVDCSASADDEDVIVPKRADRRADGDMEVRVAADLQVSKQEMNRARGATH